MKKNDLTWEQIDILCKFPHIEKEFEELSESIEEMTEMQEELLDEAKFEYEKKREKEELLGKKGYIPSSWSEGGDSHED